MINSFKSKSLILNIDILRSNISKNTNINDFFAILLNLKKLSITKFVKLNTFWKVLAGYQLDSSFSRIQASNQQKRTV